MAPTTAAILITGKQAQEKSWSPTQFITTRREKNPLIKINCAAIAKTLMESELFGHEKGAYAGAAVTKPGKFELAHKGTLFLDEVSEIPAICKVKLLRVLQERNSSESADCAR